MSEEKQYKIKLTLENGKTVYWKKRGQTQTLPEEIVDTWIQNFKPDVFEINEQGEMVNFYAEQVMELKAANALLNQKIIIQKVN